MGLLESLFKVTYKGDTSDLKSKIRELSGEEKKLAQERLASMEAQNKVADAALAKWTKWGIGIAAAGVLVKGAFDALEFAGKRADLTAAAAGVSIDGLRKATLGLRTDTELLTTAAKLNHSVFSVSQKDMETASRAMVALGERGGDAAAAVDAVTEALVTGGTNGLKAYGIEIDETKDKAAKYAEIMKALKMVSGEVNESTLDQSDSVAQLKVSFTNSIDKIKVSLGELAIAMTPLLKALAAAVGLIADIVSGAKITDDIESLIRNKNVTQAGTMAGYSALGAARFLEQRTKSILGVKEIEMEAQSGRRSKRAGGDSAEATEIGTQIASGVSGAGIDVALNQIQEALIAKAAADTSAMIRQSGSASMGSYDVAGLQSQLDQFQGGEFQKRNAEAYGAFNDKKKDSFLASTFGPIEEFNIYATAFSTLSGAVGASLSAWIDGSMSAGAAFKKFIGEALKGIAVQMAMESLKHGAYAIGNLAFGNLAGAATHGKAALAFAAGAAMTATVAREFGGGGGATASGGGGRVGAPNVGGGGGGNAQTTERIIVYGDAMTDSGPREQALYAERMLKRVGIGNPAVQRS